MDEEYNSIAKDYSTEIDFAFFFVHFGTSKDEYLELTDREKIFIRKAWEEKTVRDTTFLRNAVLNAVSNALRKKSAKFQELWTKMQQPLDKELAKNHLALIQEVEETEGKSWVDLVYQENGLAKPERSD